MVVEKESKKDSRLDKKTMGSRGLPPGSLYFGLQMERGEKRERREKKKKGRPQEQKKKNQNPNENQETKAGEKKIE